MTDMLGVDTGVMETAATDVAAAVTALRGCVTDMEASLAPLSRLWTGAAADAFTTARATWRGHLADMVDVLERLGAATDTSTARYATTEADVTTLWR